MECWDLLVRISGTGSVVAGTDERRRLPALDRFFLDGTGKYVAVVEIYELR